MTKIIKVENLSKHYNGLAAVDDISFEVDSGELFAFLGPNGAGKTTTIKMLTTLLNPTAGRIELNGVNPLQNPHKVRESFGIVFQDQSLDEELTAYENMEYHGVLYRIEKDKRRRRIEELLKYVELWDRRNDYVKKFSGGMRRRLEIARGLMHHPKILFLDEPTLGLDPQTRNHIWSYIINLNKKEMITVFFTTHYMEEAERYANKISIIDHGKIIKTGTPKGIVKETKKKNLESAFIALTGSKIREEEAGTLDHLRMRSKMWRKRR